MTNVNSSKNGLLAITVILALGATVFSLLGCHPAKFHEVITTTPGPTVEVPVPYPVPAPPDTEQQKIDKMVADENEYRVSQGQTVISPGLSCTLQSFTGGDRIQASIANHNTFQNLVTRGSFTYFGEDASTTFQQYDSPVNTGLNVLPAPYRAAYTNMFLLRCQGQLVVTANGTVSFELYSDDGSLLFLDGSKLIDNDNNHGITLVTGTKALRKGIHTFRIDFAQSGGGSQALVLRANGTSIAPRYFFH